MNESGRGSWNPICIKFVSSKVGSSIDFYAKKDSYWINQGFSGILAETLFFRNGSKIRPSSTNTTKWTYTEIYMNDDFRDSSFTNNQAQGTIIHEGHIFGLDEIIQTQEV